MQADRAAIGEAVVVVASIIRATVYLLADSWIMPMEGVAPFAVVANFRAAPGPAPGGLLVVRFGVELVCSGVSGGRVLLRPDGSPIQRRESHNQENHLVAQVLQLAHLVEHHGVADVDVEARSGAPGCAAARPWTPGAPASWPVSGATLRTRAMSDLGLSDPVGQRFVTGDCFSMSGDRAPLYSQPHYTVRIFRAAVFAVHRPKFALYPFSASTRHQTKSQLRHTPPWDRTFGFTA